MLKRARSETGELKYTRHSGIESGHVLTTCRGEVGGATATALDELRGCLHEVAGVELAFAAYKVSCKSAPSWCSVRSTTTNRSSP